MAQNKNIFIKIQVDNKAAKSALDSTSNSIDNVSNSSDKLTQAKKRLAFELSNEGKELARLNASIKAQRAANDALTGSTIRSAVEEARATVRKREHQAEVKRLVYEMENAGKVASTYANRLQSTAKPFSMLNFGVEKNTKSLKNNRAQAGLNNAILIETGRVASDAAYGMQGIANNLGRLIELGQEYSRTGQGGMLGALKQLGKSLMGAGGVIVAIQLLLSFAPRLIRFFKDQVKPVNEYEKAIKEATKSIEDQIYTLDNLRSALDTYGDIGKFTQDTAKLFAAVSSEFRSAYESIQEGGTLEFVDSSQEKRLLKGEEALGALVKRYKLLLQARIDENALSAKIDKRREDGLVVSQTLLGRYTDAVRKRFDLEIKVSQDKKGTVEKDAEFELKVFEQKLDDLTKLEERYRRNSIDNTLMTEEEKIALQEKFSLKDLEIRQKAFEVRERQRLKNFKEQTEAQRKQELEAAIKSNKKSKGTPDDLKARQLEINKKFDAAILDAEIKLQEELTDSKRQAAEVEVQINAVTAQKLDNLSDKRRDKAIDNIAKIQEAQRKLAIAKENLAEQESFLDADYIGRLEFSRKQIDATIEQTEAEDLRLRSIKENTDAEIASLEEKLSAAEEGSSKEALLLQNLTDLRLISLDVEDQITSNQDKNSKARIKISNIEAQARVQALQVTGDALMAFSKLAGEDTKVGKRLAIAGTLISTYLSAQKAFESQFTPIASADSPVRGVIAAAAAVAAGLARVKAITQVDASGKTSASASPPSPSVQIQAPDFNVVGASATNQLAEAVAGQTQQPVKAYVSLKELEISKSEYDRTAERGKL